MVDGAVDSSIWTCKLGAIGHQFKHNLHCSSSSHTYSMHTNVHKHTHSAAVCHFRYECLRARETLAGQMMQ